VINALFSLKHGCLLIIGEIDLNRKKEEKKLVATMHNAEKFRLLVYPQEVKQNTFDDRIYASMVYNHLSKPKIKRLTFIAL
jgi:hypothetical protein